MQLGIVGLGRMGGNMAQRLLGGGHDIVAYDPNPEAVEAQTSAGAAGAASLGELALKLDAPRAVWSMVPSGDATEATIAALADELEPGDTIIDGGNANYKDTIRRAEALSEKGISLLDSGTSGGVWGLAEGYSLMIGGDRAAFDRLEPIFQTLAPGPDRGYGHVGGPGSGHFVKMVHNGIEYGDMQVIAEAYHLMRVMLGMTCEEMAGVFRTWGRGLLDSYLVNITADILGHVDGNGHPTLELILDAAGQKGTGKWAVISSLDLGYPLTLVAEAVYARVVSSLRDQRFEAAELVGSEVKRADGLGADFVDDIHDALYASKIVSYAQGFMLLGAAADEYGWNLDYGRIAQLWREGCIIKAAFLDDITAAFRRRPDLPNLILDRFFADALGKAEAGWRRVVATAVQVGLPVPAYASALAFYDSYRSKRLPANLIQAQRDYFGAHTYERVDRPRGEFFHTDWTTPNAG
jgi:6-phosphogluconate dehydrogenase